MHPKIKALFLEDDTKENIIPLITHRIPWLFIGLLGGIISTIFSSRFETLVSSNVQLAFFIPVIIYMADALCTQTVTIYVRNLTKRKTTLGKYILKEFIVGLVMGILFGLILGIAAYIIFQSMAISLIVALTLSISMITAPFTALIVSTILFREHTDPALGAGPFSNIIQDFINLVIYFMVASLILGL